MFRAFLPQTWHLRGTRMLWFGLASASLLVSRAPARAGSPTCAENSAAMAPIQLADDKFSGNVAQYLVDLHDSKAAFDFCGALHLHLNPDPDPNPNPTPNPNPHPNPKQAACSSSSNSLTCSVRTWPSVPSQAPAR